MQALSLHVLLFCRTLLFVAIDINVAGTSSAFIAAQYFQWYLQLLLVLKLLLCLLREGKSSTRGDRDLFSSVGLWEGFLFFVCCFHHQPDVPGSVSAAASLLLSKSCCTAAICSLHIPALLQLMFSCCLQSLHSCPRRLGMTQNSFTFPHHKLHHQVLLLL